MCMLSTKTDTYVKLCYAHQSFGNHYPAALLWVGPGAEDSRMCLRLPIKRSDVISMSSRRATSNVRSETTFRTPSFASETSVLLIDDNAGRLLKPAVRIEVWCVLESG